MNKKKVSVVITDLDNTLYDWFRAWYSSFKSMLDILVSESGIAEDILIKEIKQIHEKHGTSEYLNLVNELPSLKAKHSDAKPSEIYKNAITVYWEKRKENLELYPSVLATLIELKKKGCLIIGYTDSQALYSGYRVKELGLDGILDFLYSSPNHELSETEVTENASFFPSTNHSLKFTIHKQTPKDASKPNPEVLISIIEDIGINSYEAIYIGDNLLNDISMAQDVPITDVYAKYGNSVQNEGYDLLRKVTHWTADKVVKEKDIQIVPTYELRESFSQLLDLFEFIQFADKKDKNSAGKANKKDEIDWNIDIWKKSIDVQQHFNDLELRIRNFALSVLGVILSGAAIAIKENSTAFVAPFLLFIGLLIWLAFYGMDRFWYHRLLIGSVKHAEKLENKLIEIVPLIGLTKSISDESPSKIFGKEIHSSSKMDWFYGIIGLILLVSGIASIIYLEKPKHSEDKPQKVEVTFTNSNAMQSLIKEAQNQNSAPVTSVTPNGNSSNVSKQIK